MKIFKTKIPTKSVATVSLVGIMSEEFPLSYGNYFSMYLNGVKLPDDMKTNRIRPIYSVCNFNHENYEEACQRFLTDNMVEITLFKPDDLDWLVIAITDERIPQDWYHMWSEMSGYCNGGIHGKTYEEVARALGKRFGGDENYVYVKPEIEETLESKVVKCSFIPVIKNNAGLVASVLGDLDLSKCEEIDVSETIKCSDKPSCLFYEGDKDE